LSCGSARAGDRWRPVELMGVDTIYYQWSSDRDGTFWGIRMTVTGLVPVVDATDKLLLDLANAGGVQPLLAFTTLSRQDLREMASKSLTSLSCVDVARKEIDRQNGIEPLLKLLETLKFRALVDIPVSTLEAEESPVKATITAGMTFAIDKRLWYNQAKPDPSRTHPGGYYRAHVVSPPSCEGWISMATGQCRRMPFDRDALQLLAVLSLESNNRDRLIELGKMKVLLNLAKQDDAICRRVAAMALDEVSGKPDKVRTSAAIGLFLHLI
jgi:hypothetical protein